LENVASKLCDKSLPTTDNNPKNNEHRIFIYTIKNVPLIVHLAATNHIENLHQDEGIKNESVMAGRTVCG